jgi:glycosyltransferase involved in cell wall biosynthesis
VNKKIAFLTTVFPMKSSYLDDFFKSLNEQTYTNFDVVVVNDGYVKFREVMVEFSNLNIIELQYSDTVAKNREFGINFVKENDYDILIFGDSDDYFDKNRVRISVELLANTDIVVNDLTLFSDANGIFHRKYISNRVVGNTQVTLEFIKNKNIFGLSNTAINVMILGDISFDKDMVAVDWYLYTILLLKNKKALFTNKTITYYRQYGNNAIGMGLGLATKEAILKSILVKSKHYHLLKKEDESFIALYENNLKLKHEFEEHAKLEELNTHVENPLWWEDLTVKTEEKETPYENSNN